MYKKIFIAGNNNFRWPFITLGISLIIFGLLIIMFPALLVVLIASFFILAGLFFLSLGWGIRKIIHKSSPPVEADFLN